MIGQVLDGRYAIVRLLGKGGMGEVYEARHAGTNRRVAVKVILGAMDAHQVARFQREARLAGSIESQHITAVYDAGYDRATGSPYMAMEMLDGEDVDALLERLGTLPVELAVRIGHQACVGLGRAHQAGIVHRDIKAANLFLHRMETGGRIVKLLDFGIAKATVGEVGNGALTKTGTLLGSPLYMSPEQANGRAVGPASDVWSLGITLYEMLSGHRPNESITHMGELILAICTRPAPPIQDQAPWVPAEIAAVVHRALGIDPATRFADAAEMGLALKALLPNGNAIEEPMIRPLDAAARAAVAPRSAPAPAGSGTVQVMSLSASSGAAPPPRSRAPLVAGAIGAAAIGAVAAVVLLGGRGVGSRSEAPAATPAASATEAPGAPHRDAPVVTPAPPSSASAVPTEVVSTAPPTKPAHPPTARTPRPPVQRVMNDDETSRK
jgi:serine/threonine-protein kinase